MSAVSQHYFRYVCPIHVILCCAREIVYALVQSHCVLQLLLLPVRKRGLHLDQKRPGEQKGSSQGDSELSSHAKRIKPEHSLCLSSSAVTCFTKQNFFLVYLVPDAFQAHLLLFSKSNLRLMERRVLSQSTDGWEALPCSLMQFKCGSQWLFLVSFLRLTLKLQLAAQKLRTSLWWCDGQQNLDIKLTFLNKGRSDFTRRLVALIGKQLILP